MEGNCGDATFSKYQSSWWSWTNFIQYIDSLLVVVYWDDGSSPIKVQLSCNRKLM